MRKGRTTIKGVVHVGTDSDGSVNRVDVVTDTGDSFAVALDEAGLKLGAGLAGQRVRLLGKFAYDKMDNASFEVDRFRAL